MILLTGATGNVGLPLVWLLSEAGIPFRAFVRDPGRAQAALGAKLGPGMSDARVAALARDIRRMQEHRANLTYQEVSYSADELRFELLKGLV